MPDGKIVIETLLDSKPIEEGTKKVKKSLDETAKQTANASKETQKLEKEMQKLKEVLVGEVPEATREAYQSINKMNQEISSTSRQFGSNSQEARKARNALNEYALGLDDTTFKQVYMRSQLGLTDAQLTQQANSIKLNARMVKLMGSQTEILTQRMKGLQENGIKPKDLLPASTLGQFKMLSETIEASGNPIYKLSAGYRALGASMEKTIKGWSAQKMAVKMAGDDMVKYGLLMRGITAGQANLAMAFPIVGVMAVAAYAAIFSSAIKANEGLQKLSETAKGKLGEAFKPLLNVAGLVVKAFLDMTIKVADLMIKFNETYPILSKVIASLALMAPAMTLLLLPLNMGIGLLAGWKVAINGAWVAISGIAGAVGLATSTFLAIGAVIGAVAWSFMYLMKTNETFRNAVIPIWEAISSAASRVFSGIGNLISKGFVATIEGAKAALNGMVELFLVTLPNAFKEGGFSGLITAIGSLFSNLFNTIATNSSQLLQAGGNVIKNFITGVQNALPQILATGSQIITSIIQGISTVLPQIVTKMNETRMLILNTIAANLPQLLTAGVQIITMLINGITQALPVIMSIGVQIINAVINTLTANLSILINTGISVLMTLLDGIIQALPILIGAGVQILMALVDAITQSLPKIIDSAMSIIDTIINTITKLLPTILDAGIKVLVALIDGISKAIPQLIAMLPTIINAIVTVITQNLPKIIEAGLQILIALINGVLKALPQLTAMLPTIINTIVTTLIQNLPLIIDSGIKIIVALIKGLIQAIPQIIGAIPQIISAIKNAFTNVDWSSIGKNIMSGIAAGIKAALGSVIESAKGVAIDIKNSMKDALGIKSPSRVMKKEIGINIVKGISVGIDDEVPTLTANIDSNIADLVSKLQSSVDYETARTTASVVAQNSSIYSQTGNTENTQNMDKLTSALNNLSKRPIQTSVEIDGEKVVKATATQSDKSSGKRLNFSERGLVL